MIPKSGPERIAYYKELKRAKVRERVAKHRKNNPKPSKKKSPRKLSETPKAVYMRKVRQNEREEQKAIEEKKELQRIRKKMPIGERRHSRKAWHEIVISLPQKVLLGINLKSAEH